MVAFTSIQCKKYNSKKYNDSLSRTSKGALIKKGPMADTDLKGREGATRKLQGKGSSLSLPLHS